MEGDTEDTTKRNLIAVEFHYNGTFAPKPLAYYDESRALVRDIDFSGMEFTDLISFVKKLLPQRTNTLFGINLYYCLPEHSLSLGLHIIQNQGDYQEFIECAYAHNNKIDVYVDHYNEPLFDWIEEEDPEDYEDGDNCEEDVDSNISDDDHCEHEKDDLVPIKRTVNDTFLNILCPEDGNDEEDGAANEHPPVYPVHDENVEWNKMVPLLGMKFSNPEELKNCITNYAVANGYDLYFEKNDKNRVLVKCGKGKKPCCPFRLWASWMKNERTFQIKSLKDTHNCSRVFKMGSIVTYKWIGKRYIHEILQKPKISLRKMKADISEKFMLSVSLTQCGNARKFALSEIEGCLNDHYAKLWDYAEEIRRSNPGSTVKMEVDIMPDLSTVFSQYYVCLKGVRDGWLEGCRKIICLDGCFLKGICRGELLSAVGRDANNHIYPLAWAVVNVENKQSWKWFIDLVMNDIGRENGAGLTLMSDGHKGLMEAVKERVPDAEHRLCARHIYANLKNRYKADHFKKPYWKAVYATTRNKFNAAMDEIKTLDNSAFDYLMEREPKHWSKAFFVEGRNCDAMENGVSESFNSAIVEARCKPIISMLEDIRVYVMDRLFQLRNKGMSWDLRICPAIRRILADLRKQQRFWVVYPSGFQEFEVTMGMEKYAVDLRKRECACRGWQLTGIPCLHGIAAISSINHDAETYVASCYTKECFIATYTHTIHPLNGSAMWPHVDYNIPQPPKRRRLPGRPKVKRNRAASETETTRHTVCRRGVMQKCSNCGTSGHNKAKCPNNKTGTSGASGSSKAVQPQQPAVQPPAVQPPAVQEAVQPQPPAVELEYESTDEEEVPLEEAPENPYNEDFEVEEGLDEEVPVEEELVEEEPPVEDEEPVQEEQPVEDEEPVQEEQPVEDEEPVQGRKRKPSQRIAKLGLRRKVVTKDGLGCSSDKPCSVE